MLTNRPVKSWIDCRILPAPLALIVLILASLACSLFKGASPKPTPTLPQIMAPSTTASPLIGEETETQPDLPAQAATRILQAVTRTLRGPSATLETANPLAGFPVYKGAAIDPPDLGYSSDSTSGSFKVQTQDGWSETSAYYEKALKAQAWTLRYTESNYQGGVRQAWKKLPIFLEMNSLIKSNGVTVEANYQITDQSLGRALLPKNFPLSGTTEFIETSQDSVTLYIHQNLAKTVTDIHDVLTGLGWKLMTDTDNSGKGSCGGSPDCGGPTYPPNMTPFPIATLEKFTDRHLVWTTAERDQVTIDLRPHRGSTVVSYSILHQNASYSGLPADVPIYKNAANIMAIPDLLTYTAVASQADIIKFTADGLKASGYQETSAYSANTPESYYQEWAKGSVTLTTIIVPINASSSSVSIQCQGCATKK